MTNQKVNIEVQDFEDKKSQNGKRYTRFKTNDGWMSAFEKDIIDSLKANEGKTVYVEIAVDSEKGFKNIRKFIGQADENIKETHQEIKAAVNGNGKDTKSMYVAYAKDIFIRLLDEYKAEKEKPSHESLMQVAIELVKQAKSEIENNGRTDDNKQE
jgi:uncharacterized membrane protein